MPVSFLSQAERARFNSCPAELAQADVIAHFTLSAQDVAQLPRTGSPTNRLGFALRLLTLRFLGFHLLDIRTLPAPVSSFVAAQIGVSAAQIAQYGERQATQTAHRRAVEQYLGVAHPTVADYQRLSLWLQQRALENDRPLLLLRLLGQQFLADKLLRPGLSVLERMVAAARSAAEAELFQRVGALLGEVTAAALDALLQPAQPHQPTPLAWLCQSASANSPNQILNGLAKLQQLQSWQVGSWDLSGLNPNRRQQLARLGGRATAQALRRMPATRRYPILLALLAQLYEEILDELVGMCSRLLQTLSARVERQLLMRQQGLALLAGDQLKLWQTGAGLLLNPDIADAEVRQAIYRLVPESQVQLARDACGQMTQTWDASFFQLLGQRYAYLRQFAPALLRALPWAGNADTEGLREAVRLLLAAEAPQRRLPADAPRDFVSAAWQPFVFDGQQRVVRKYYELCVLFALRQKLRSGDLWVPGSRRYAKLESYLIAPAAWAEVRPQVCALLGLPERGEQWLALRQRELEELCQQFDGFFENLLVPAQTPGSGLPAAPESLAQRARVRLEDGKLVVTRLPGEELRPGSLALKEEIARRLPTVELTDLLLEVAGWTGFTNHFGGPGEVAPESAEALRCVLAGLLAQACNFGLAQMARMSGLVYHRLSWHTTWRLRAETLSAACTTLVNFHHRLELAQVWGGGTLSSSDGQRFPVPVSNRHAVALPKYFGYGRGLTYYTWTADQYAPYGTKVIPSTVRDATYVLDEILGHETELTILEHTTDTAGYTDLVFGLFDLLGLQFSPRWADLGAKKLYRIDKQRTYRHLEPLLTGTIKTDVIVRHWDELLRVAGSLKQGYVTASLLISKLQAHPQKNALTRALQEYGRLNESIFLLKYLPSAEYQRKITLQLNKGEALHALRRQVFVGREGKIQQRHEEEQQNQALCLNLVVNAIVVWNTVYLKAVLEQLVREGYEVREEDVKHLSPARSEHLNMYGKYSFNVEEEAQRVGLRELRPGGANQFW